MPLTKRDFEDEDEELSRIMKYIANRVGDGDRIGSIFDINGNKIGYYRIQLVNV